MKHESENSKFQKSRNPNFDKSAKIFVFVLLMANFFSYLGMSIVTIGLPFFILSLSGTLASYGLVISIFSITQAIFQFPMAVSSDKYGRKKIIAIGFSMYIIGTFLCFYAQNIFQLVIFRAIQGAGAYSSILQAMIGDYYRKEEHGKGMAYYSFSLSLGYLGGIVLGGYLSYFLGFRVTFLISGILAIISAMLIYLFYKDLRNSRYTDDEIKNNKEEIKISDIKLLFKEKQYRIIIIINCIRWFIFNGIISYLIWVLEIHWALSEIETSYVLIYIVGIYIAFVLFTGKLVDNFNTKKIILWGQLLIISMGFFYFIDNLMIFLIASIFTGIGLALFQTAGNSQLLRVIDESYPDLKGSGFGFNNAVGFLCGAFGPLIFCSIGEISLFYSFYVIFVFTLFAFLITLKFLKI